MQFILGRAGTGKSRLISERIIEQLKSEPLGPPIYLLVPAQATFAHERHFALAAGVQGYARLRVVSFEMLGEDVIAECGGEAMVQVTSVGRQMLLGHLLRKHAGQLGYFQGVARQLGLVAELDRTFAELERAGRSSGELVEALPELSADTVPPEHRALVEKARDLALLGEEYRRALGEDRLDATRRLEHVMKNLEGCRGLREARIYVDGFYRFSAFERKLLARLAGLVREMWIALTLDPRDVDRTFHETDLFFQTATTYRQLCAQFNSANVSRPIEMLGARRFASPALAAIEQDWSNPRPSSRAAPDSSAVLLIEAPDRRAEADAAARQVRAWTRQGYRLRDISVLCRDLPVMQPLLEASFREHAIAFFMDRRRPAAHHPLARFVRSLLKVATRNWPHEAVMDLCKCGLAGLSLDEADALENYALEHRIRGKTAWTSQQPWRFHIVDADSGDEDDELKPPPIDEQPDRADASRRKLADAIMPLAEALRREQPVKQHLAALWTCMDAFGVRQRLARQIAQASDEGHLEEAAEHQQAWQELMALFEQAVELLGEETLSGEDFASSLEYGLDLLDLAIVPPQADEVVIGDVERTRTLGCRAAVVMGLSDGTFPRAHRDATVLSDADRRELRSRQVDVEPDGSTLQLTERFLAYRAFAAPSERLTLTRAASEGEGRPASPSPFWEHVQKLLGVTPQKLAHDAKAPECIGTPRQLAAALMQWARGDAPLHQKLKEPVAALYQFFATHQDTESPLGRIRRLAWRALSYENKATLRPETSARLWKEGTLYTSVSRLETFAACPFRHYAAYVLDLRGRDEQDTVTPMDLGTVYHGALERLVRHCIARKLEFIDPASISDEQVATITREVGAKIRGRILLSSARNEYLLKRIETTLRGVLAGGRAVLARGSFRPIATELKFGEGEGAQLPPLELGTPRGRRVRLYGQIDRVDYSPTSGRTAVVDYKFSGKLLKLDEATYGLTVQLLLYLLVLERNGASLADPAPRAAAALYVKLLRGIDRARHPDEVEGPGSTVFDLRVKPRGVIAADAAEEIDTDYVRRHDRPAWSDGYSISLRDDGPAANAGNDLLEARHFRALLAAVEKRVLELADELIDGCVAARPYKMSTVTPCPHCDYRSLCRFDPATDNYLPLEPRKRSEVLRQLEEEFGEGA